jgi:hypothetical protein
MHSTILPANVSRTDLLNTVSAIILIPLEWHKDKESFVRAEWAGPTRQHRPHPHLF